MIEKFKDWLGGGGGGRKNPLHGKTQTLSGTTQYMLDMVLKLDIYTEEQDCFKILCSVLIRKKK